MPSIAEIQIWALCNLVHRAPIEDSRMFIQCRAFSYHGSIGLSMWRAIAREWRGAKGECNYQTLVYPVMSMDIWNWDTWDIIRSRGVYVDVQRTPMWISVSNSTDRDPWIYTHCLFPKCETNAPAYPVSMLALSQSDLIVWTAPSTGTGPLKWGA